MTTVSLRTLPPYAEIVAVEKTITKNNIGMSYIGWPYDWGGNYAYNAAPTDNRAGNPSNHTFSNLLNQYSSTGWQRTFYPPAANVWNPTQGIAPAPFQALLNTLDFWGAKSNKVIWLPDIWRGLHDGNVVWAGYDETTLAGEQAVVNFWTACLTPQYTSSTSNSIGIGSKSWTIATGLLLTTGNYLKFYNSSAPTNWEWGNVTAYNSGSGLVTVNITNINGSGAGITTWNASICSDAGTAFVESTALGAIEIANERVFSSSAGDTASMASYGRACRITSSLFKQYMPAVRIIGISSDQTHTFMTYYLQGATDTLGATGVLDNGVGNQASDYMDVIANHWYHFHDESQTNHYAAVANNRLCSGYTKLTDNSLLYGVLNAECNFNTTSHLYGNPITSSPIWNTESSIRGNLSPIYPTAGGWAWWLDNATERYNNLIRWYLPTLFSTQDFSTSTAATPSLSSGGTSGTNSFVVSSATGLVIGQKVTGTGLTKPTIVTNIVSTTITLSQTFTSNGSGTYNFYNSGELGTSFFYGLDLTGDSASGSSGTIAHGTVANNGGSVQITSSGTPANGWMVNRSIVITAGAGGWSDLGLSAAQSKRFLVTPSAGNLVLQGTNYTAQPAADATYTEYQLFWGPFPEELATFVALITTAPVSFGWIHYPGATYQGIWFNVKGVGTWYTTSSGDVRQW